MREIGDFWTHAYMIAHSYARNQNNFAETKRVRRVNGNTKLEKFECAKYRHTFYTWYKASFGKPRQYSQFTDLSFCRTQHHIQFFGGAPTRFVSPSMSTSNAPIVVDDLDVIPFLLTRARRRHSSRFGHCSFGTKHRNMRRLRPVPPTQNQQ